MTVGFVRADLDYVPGAAEALAPDAAEPRTEQTALPIVLSEGQAKVIAERALGEARVGRDSLSCNLPLSMLSITPGDVVSLADGGTTDLYRIDRIEDLGHRAITGVRVEPTSLRGAGGRDPGKPAQRLGRGVARGRGFHRAAAADGG